MWKRKEVKRRGKKAMKANYWKCVLVAMIFAFLCGGGGIGGSIINKSHDLEDAVNGLTHLNSNDESGFEEGDLYDLDGYLRDEDYMDSEDVSNKVDEIAEEAQKLLLDNKENLILGLLVLIPFILLGVALGLAIGAFFLNIMEVGIDGFFTKNLNESANLGLIGGGFSNHYMTNVVTMLLKGIFTALWSMLFVIPGIIKAYEYRMIPYILADNEEITRKEAFAKSKQMMRGNKWRAFVFDLSFIGWHLLGLITFGIAEIFYVQPYYRSACAALYDELKMNEF